MFVIESVRSDTLQPALRVLAPLQDQNNSNNEQIDSSAVVHRRIDFVQYGKRTYIRDYDEQIEPTKQNFAEIYNLYRRGAVIIDKVYKFEKEGKEQVGIRYHYR